VSQGQIPACVEICKTGALTFEVLDVAMRRKTQDVARSMSADPEGAAVPAGVALLTSIKQAELRLGGR
jgi:carbon-monoxide dehydrogenase iron sulfur subunit